MSTQTATLENVAAALGIDRDANPGNVIDAPEWSSEDFIGYTTLEIEEVEYPTDAGERWFGSWSLGPRKGATLDEVLAWVETTRLR